MKILPENTGWTDLFDYIKIILALAISHITLNSVIGVVSLIYICLKTFYLIRSERKNNNVRHKKN